MLKTIITYGLSILLFTGAFNVHLHKITTTTGYGICKIGCYDKNPYNSVDQCEKCLTSNIKPANPDYCGFRHDEYIVSFHSLSKSIKKSIFNYSLFSRPPPNLI